MTYAQAMRLAARLAEPSPSGSPRAAPTTSFDDVGMVWCHAPAALSPDLPELCCASADDLAPAERAPPPTPPRRQPPPGPPRPL